MVPLDLGGLDLSLNHVIHFEIFFLPGAADNKICPPLLSGQYIIVPLAYLLQGRLRILIPSHTRICVYLYQFHTTKYHVAIETRANCRRPRWRLVPSLIV